MVSATLPPFYPRERPGTHCTGGWVGPRADLDVCEKSLPHQDSIPGPSSQSLHRLSYRAHKGLRSIKSEISYVHANLWTFPSQRPIRKIQSKGIIAVFETRKYTALTENGKHNYQCDVKLTTAINRHSPMMLAHKPCANCNGLGSGQQFPPPCRLHSNNTLPSTLPRNCGQTGAGLVETVAVGGVPCNELPGP
jgi:hypothetical protein